MTDSVLPYLVAQRRGGYHSAACCVQSESARALDSMLGALMLEANPNCRTGGQYGADRHTLQQRRWQKKPKALD